MGQLTRTAVLDSDGLHAWAADPLPQRIAAVIEAALRNGGLQVLSPTVTLVEAHSDTPARDVPIDRLVKRGYVRLVDGPDQPTARAAATRRQRHTRASAVDALVAHLASQHPGSVIYTSDRDDLERLLDNPMIIDT